MTFLQLCKPRLDFDCGCHANLEPAVWHLCRNDMQAWVGALLREDLHKSLNRFEASWTASSAQSGLLPLPFAAELSDARNLWHLDNVVVKATRALYLHKEIENCLQLPARLLKCFGEGLHRCQWYSAWLRDHQLDMSSLALEWNWQWSRHSVSIFLMGQLGVLVSWSGITRA